MRYSIQPREQNYGKWYSFLSFPRRFADKCGKKLMYSAKNTGTDAAKTTSKKIVQKTAEATGDLIGNKYQIKLLQ